MVLSLTRYAKIEKIIAGWEEEFPSDAYVYRGQSRIYSSGTGAAYRRVPSTLLRILPDKKKDCDMKELEARLVSCELPHFPPHTSFFEARTEARHVGHPTGCIDFSNNILAALYFACSNHDQLHGELLFLNISDMPFVPALGQDLLAAPALPQGDTIVVEASHTEYSAYLHSRQSSVLALPQTGYIDFDKSHTRRVFAGNKSLFKDYLEANYISKRTLNAGPPPREAGKARPRIQRRISEGFPRNYEDIERLLRHHDDLVRSSDPYESGKEYYCRGEYEKALECFYAMAQPSSPSRPSRELNLFLASTYLHLCQYQRALAQLKQLPQSAWSDVEYFMAAEGSFYLGDTKAALSNIERARNENPNRPIYHRALVSIAVKANDYDLAEVAAGKSFSSSRNLWDSRRLLAEIARQRKKAK